MQQKPQKNLPPLNALRAFVATARNKSVTEAAKNLHVSHSAVSQQLKLLEQYLDIPLLHREPGKISLTVSGEQYYNALAPAFDAIRSATNNILRRKDDNMLVIKLSSTLATQWFIPRLHSFQAEHPDIQLQLATAPDQPGDFAEHQIDCAIYCGYKNEWPDLVVTPLFEDEISLVCSPKILEGKEQLDLRDNYRNYQYCYVTADARLDDWPLWFSKTKLPKPPKENWAYFPNSIQALQAARTGLSLALSHNLFIENDLRSGSLTKTSKHAIPTGKHYCFVCPPNAHLSHKIRTLANWLKKETNR